MTELASKTKATFYLPDDLLRAARVRAAREDRRDSDVVAEALRGYLGYDVLERVWARNPKVREDDAMKLAVGEIHSTRATKKRAPRRP